MNLTEAADLIGAIVGFLLTVMVFSYLFGDNALFRLAVHLFIGAAAGYATMIVAYNILWYQLLVPLMVSPLEQALVVGPPLLLGLWLLLRVSNTTARYATPVLALMVGIGAAAAVGGAVKGTLFPQMNAAMGGLDLDLFNGQAGGMLFWFFNGLVTLVGTITTLVYFHFGVRSRSGQPASPRPWIEITGMVGQGFIAVTLGALFAGVYASALAAFVERTYFLWNFFWSLVGRFISIQ
jgi:hypothetical protein